MHPAPCRHLFVYGTLMSTASGPLGHDMRLRLRRESALVGPATLPGRLYDLGDYPAMVRTSTPDDIVHGELLELANPSTSLAHLDEYEGIGRGAQAIGEYVRDIAPVLLRGADAAIDAWVYLYNRPLVDFECITGGRWTGQR